MGTLVRAGLMPHAPVLLSEVGGASADRVSVTDLSMRELASRLVDSAPDLVVIISPHTTLFSDAIAVHGMDQLSGDFSAFGCPSVSYSVANDLEFVAAFERALSAIGLSTVRINEESARVYNIKSLSLDHGVLVPYHYLRRAGYTGKLMVMAFAMYPAEDLCRVGMVLRKTVDESDRRVAVVASGDLSHRLTKDAAAGYSEDGSRFDYAVVDALAAGDLSRLFTMDSGMVERAGECGLRPLQILSGSLGKAPASSEVLSYEGPFGVGYAVVDIEPSESGEGSSLLDFVVDRRRTRMGDVRKREGDLVSLARRAVEEYVLRGVEIRPADDLPDPMAEPGAVFCSIKKDGILRGCIGTIEPVCQSLAEEVIRNAISAATSDPRFPRVTEDELESLTYSVDVLSPPEPVSGRDELDPKLYGLIVEKDGRRGLLLPDLDGVDTVDDQVDIAMRKAGISSDEGLSLKRFTVERYK